LRFLAREDEDELIDEADGQPLSRALGWRWTAAIAAAAAIPRLVYVFVFSNPENPGLGVYDDVWHHWQIGYLTKEIGLSAPDGPRLWDLKGLEYFWGILHPLLMALVFAVTGSIDIVLLRLVSVAFGVGVVVLVFLICRRYWGTQVAIAATLFASLLPTSVMNDASGMLEPIGVALCMLGLWCWVEGKGGWAGAAFGLATMARAEAWIFSLGLVVATNLRRFNVRQRAGLWFAFGGTVAFYALVLWAKTGNPVYPLWWNFVANALGEWGTPITSEQVGARPALGLALILAVAGLVWTLRRRPAGYMLLTFGFGYWVFTAGMLGFTSFLSTWQWWMPISRRFEFPYEFVGILLSVVALRYLPQRIGWSAVVIALVAAQVAWVPISAAFGPTEVAWRLTMADATHLGRWYQEPSYRGHVLAIPADRPDITYGLARFGGVDGRHLVSEMYGPFDGDQPAAAVRCWLAKTDVRLIAISATDSNLTLLVRQNPTWFVRVGTMDEARWDVYAVNAPPPTAAECASAR